MDLRTIANQVSNTVNPNVIVSLQVSTGFTKTVGQKQVPTYAAPVMGPAQIQALDGSDLKQMEGMNIQGTIKAIYIRGALNNVIRPNQVGGDLITVSAPAPAAFLGKWLVVKILEKWPLWTKAAIVLQNP